MYCFIVKADKIAEQLKTEREKQEQQTREDELREMAIRLRRRLVSGSKDRSVYIQFVFAGNANLDTLTTVEVLVHQIQKAVKDLAKVRILKIDVQGNKVKIIAKKQESVIEKKKGIVRRGGVVVKNVKDGIGKIIGMIEIENEIVKKVEIVGRIIIEEIEKFHSHRQEWYIQ